MYYDEEGKEISLYRLVVTTPEWAVSRISNHAQELSKQQGIIDELVARINYLNKEWVYDTETSDTTQDNDYYENKILINKVRGNTGVNDE